ncbi:MAG: hypothetical protein ACRD2H_11785 [Terriglobales bacterium]
MPRRNENGGIGLGGLLVLLVLAGAIYAGYKFLPPMIANFQFNNDVQQEARMAVYNGDSDDQIDAKLLAQAQALGAPVTAAQIVIERQGPDIFIAVRYDVPVELPTGKEVTLHFNDGSKGILITQE